MDQRIEFAMKALRTENFRALCAEYGISPKTGYKWRDRLLEDEGLGRFAEDLPPIGVETLLANLRVADNFMEWLQTREVSAALPISNWPTLASIIA